MAEDLPLRQKNVHFIRHPAERMIERGLNACEIKRIIYSNYTVPDAKGKYPDTKIAVGMARGRHWSVPYTEHPQDIFVITARPSRKDEIAIYRRMVKEKWRQQ